MTGLAGAFPTHEPDAVAKDRIATLRPVRLCGGGAFRRIGAPEDPLEDLLECLGKAGGRQWRLAGLLNRLQHGQACAQLKCTAGTQIGLVGAPLGAVDRLVVDDGLQRNAQVGDGGLHGVGSG